VELLVSSAILAIVLAIMFAALSTGMSLWRNTDGKIAADREARASEFVLVRDLANIVMPASSTLWPRVTNRSDGISYLAFLTSVPPGYQSGNELGDVCYVEYAIVSSTNFSVAGGPLPLGAPRAGKELRRLFWPSLRTYTNVITNGVFPSTNSATNTDFQSLGLNLLPENKMAARGMVLANEANNTNFIVLGPDMLPYSGSVTPSNYPAAIEVNFAVADPETLANSNLVEDASFIMRNAGLYSFRIPLPKPPSVTP
jgi:hypothetical protein